MKFSVFSHIFWAGQWMVAYGLLNIDKLHQANTSGSKKLVHNVEISPMLQKNINHLYTRPDEPFNLERNTGRKESVWAKLIKNGPQSLETREQNRRTKRSSNKRRNKTSKHKTRHHSSHHRSAASKGITYYQRRRACTTKSQYISLEEAEDVYGDMVKVTPLADIGGTHLEVAQIFHESYCEDAGCSCFGVASNTYRSSCETQYSYTTARIIKDGYTGWSMIKVRSGCACILGGYYKNLS